MEGMGGGREGREGKGEEGREGKEGRLDGEGRGGRKGRDEGKGKGRGWEGELVQPPPTTCLRHAPASIAAAEKRLLSCQTPQSVHMVRNCGAQTLPLTMHYGGKKIGGK